MLLSSRSLQFIGAVTPNRTFKAAMSSYSFSARGRNQWRRGFCDRTSARGYEERSQVDAFVSGDSHVGDVRTANYAHRHSYPKQQFRPWRPSPPPFRAGPPPKSADHRNWIFSASQPPPDRERFKVLSYNILANYLALDHHSTLYFHIPDHILAWEWRKRRLFIEFGLWSPDIMCLQEVDQFCDLEGELAIRGYAGIWKMRTGNAIDGCAIFWRTNRFQLRHEEHIEFSKLGLRDNVAQICVLESTMRFTENAALSSSNNRSSGANQVVVCNIHVLYNPKRGEIKLGQVRILLDRALTISKAWNDAPVIVCGDFNSIPMSPLYKFIATRKLDLSGLARDQISGQYSATLHRRPYSRYSSYRPQIFSRHVSEGTFGAEESYCKNTSGNQHNMGNFSPIEESAATLYQDVEQKAHGQMSFGAATIKLGELSHQGGEVSLTHSELANMPNRTTENCNQQSVICANIDADKIREEAHKNILDEPFSEGHNVSPRSDLTEEIKLTSTSCMSKSTASPLQNDVNFHGFQIDFNNVANAPSWRSNEDGFSTMDSSKAGDTSSEEIPFTTCASLEVQMVENTEKSSIGSAVTGKAGAGSLITCQNSGKGNGLNLNPDGSINSFGDSNNVDSDKILEEIPSFCGNLNTLNETSESPEEFSLEENADSNFFKELLGMEDDNKSMKDVNSPNLELQEDTSFPIANTDFNVGRHIYDPYCWSPMEMEIASGNAKRTIVEHSLKLRSVYTDVQDYTGTKDSNREPQVTSYNRQFMGTVDYIWCSEDLQTVKVLDTIPKHVLQRTPGFPTQKWGSDHIALACELAFSKGSHNK